MNDLARPPAHAGVDRDEPEGSATSALAGLIARARAESLKGPLPLDRWDPPFCGDIDMRVAFDGTWHYAGSAIRRERLVRLFASILRREDNGRFVLVTPVEKVGIVVEDAPFLGVELALEGDGEQAVVVLRTNMGDVVRLGPDHPIRFADEARHGGFIPYVQVRPGLDARLTRPVAMEVAHLLTEREGALGLRSAGCFFPVPASHRA